MIPRCVARMLEQWMYHPSSRDDFAQNFLSRRIGVSADRDRSESQNPARRMFASLCAVPMGGLIERFPEYHELLNWLKPTLVHYDPPGVWMPDERQTFTSHGTVFYAEDYQSAATAKDWRSYMLVGRDGYVEFGRQAGFPYKGRGYYNFAPLVAWVQRFVGFTFQLRTRQLEPAQYMLVLNMPDTAGASLAGFGHLWREPWDPMNGASPTAMQPCVQICRELATEDDPRAVGRWFAERVANSFGENYQPPRCYNHPNSDGSAGAPGELPRGKVEY